jgi:GNAT superfamily N-acetyltransferase
VADSVRLALPGEAGAIAELQRRGWSSAVPENLGTTMLAAVTVEEMIQAWYVAVTRPPEARFRVLVAVGDGRVVGFATTRPSPDGDADVASDGMVEEFVVDPVAQRRGHGSRLLHACVDTLRSDGFVRATWWLGTDEEILRTFLTDAGWALDGGHREIGSDDEAIRIKQVRLHTQIAEPSDR